MEFLSWKSTFIHDHPSFIKLQERLYHNTEQIKSVVKEVSLMHYSILSLDLYRFQIFSHQQLSNRLVELSIRYSLRHFLLSNGCYPFNAYSTDRSKRALTASWSSETLPVRL